MEPFDRGPLDLTWGGARRHRYVRAIFDGTTLRIYAEWKEPGGTPHLVYSLDSPEWNLNPNHKNIGWVAGEITYLLSKALGCGCNYKGLFIAQATPEELLNV